MQRQPLMFAATLVDSSGVTGKYFCPMRRSSIHTCSHRRMTRIGIQQQNLNVALIFLAGLSVVGKLLLLVSCY
jgi:hypothetical protein